MLSKDPGVPGTPLSGLQHAGAAIRICKPDMRHFQRGMRKASVFCKDPGVPGTPLGFPEKTKVLGGPIPDPP